MTDIQLLQKWKTRLRISGTVILRSISKSQVVYHPSVPLRDRYFVGISLDTDPPIIYHSRDLTEEDILHELLHLKVRWLPEWVINLITKIVL